MMEPCRERAVIFPGCPFLVLCRLSRFRAGGKQKRTYSKEQKRTNVCSVPKLNFCTMQRVAHITLLGRGMLSKSKKARSETFGQPVLLCPAKIYHSVIQLPFF